MRGTVNIALVSTSVSVRIVVPSLTEGPTMRQERCTVVRDTSLIAVVSTRLSGWEVRGVLAASCRPSSVVAEEPSEVALVQEAPSPEGAGLPRLEVEQL